MIDQTQTRIIHTSKIEDRLVSTFDGHKIPFEIDASPYISAGHKIDVDEFIYTNEKTTELPFFDLSFKNSVLTFSIKPKLPEDTLRKSFTFQVRFGIDTGINYIIETFKKREDQE